MSHVTRIPLNINSLDALQAACEAIGLELVKNQKTFRWYGRFVGDTTPPEGFSAKDYGKCEHAIRVPGKPGAYEIGVVKRRDGKTGYTLLADFWMGGNGLTKVAGENANRLNQQYNVEVGKRWARKNGYTPVVKSLPNGKKVVEARRY